MPQVRLIKEAVGEGCHSCDMNQAVPRLPAFEVLPSLASTAFGRGSPHFQSAHDVPRGSMRPLAIWHTPE